MIRPHRPHRPHRSARPVGWMARAAAAVCTAVVLAVLGALPAAAHNVLIASDPAAESVLSTPPSTITLTFDQEVENFAPQMAVTIGTAAPVAFTPQIDGQTVTGSLASSGVTAPPDEQGVMWKVGYRVVSADGHPVSGLVVFTVGGPAPTTTASTAAEKTGAEVWPYVSGGAALLVGGAAAAFFLHRRSRTDR